MADGEIRINTKLDNKEFVAGSRELLNAVKSLQNTTAKMGRDIASSANGYGAAMRQNVKASREYEAELKRLTAEAAKMKQSFNQRANDTGYKQFMRMRNEVHRLETELDAANKKVDEIRATKGTGSNAFTNALKTANDLAARLDGLKDKMQKMNVSDADILNMHAQEQSIQQVEARIKELAGMRNTALKAPYLSDWQQMTTLSKQVSEGFGRIQYAAGMAFTAIRHPIQAVDRALGFVIQKVGTAISSFARWAGGQAVSFLKRLASEAKNAAIQLARLAANAVSSGLKKISVAAGGAVKGLLGMNRAQRSANNGLKVGLKNILKYAFGIRSMFFLFRRLRRAVSEGFGELKNQNPEVKAALDSLSQSFNALKGSLAAAFAPIVTAVAPALTTLINMLTRAMNTVAAFMAALSGQSVFQKSVGALNGVGKAAGGAAKKTKELKRELAGFDQLNILNNKDNGGGGGGGGGAGGGFAYKTEKIDSGIADFVDHLKELWKNEDYEGIGDLIAKSINRVFSKAYKKVKWNAVRKKWTKAIKAFTGIFNGLIKGIDWRLIGRTVSEGINTLLEAAKTLLAGISFADAGRAFANALNGFFSNRTMWKNAGKAITTAIRSFIDFGKAFIEGFNAEQVADDILSAIKSVSWNSLASDAWDLIKTAFSKAGSFINVLLGGSFKRDADNPYEAVEAMWERHSGDVEVGSESVWDELADGFATGINRFVAWATDFVTNLPVRGIVSALANWLIRVKSQISWENLGKFFGASFGKIFNGFATIIQDFKDNATQNGKNIGTALQKAIETAFGALDEEGNTLGSIFTSLVTGAFDFLSAFLGAFKPAEIGEKLREQMADIPWDEIAKSAWELFKEALQTAGDFITALLGGDVNFRDSAINIEDARSEQRALRSGGKPAGTERTAGNTASALAGALSGALVDGLNSLKGIIESVDWKKVGTAIGEFVTSVDWSKLAGAILDVLSELLNGIFTAISALDDVLSRKVFGENYQENEAWQFLHPVKYAEYVDNMRKQWSEENPELAARQNKLIDDTNKILEDTVKSLFSGDVLPYTLNDLLGTADLVNQTNPDEEQLNRAEEAMANLQKSIEDNTKAQDEPPRFDKEPKAPDEKQEEAPIITWLKDSWEESKAATEAAEAAKTLDNVTLNDALDALALDNVTLNDALKALNEEEAGDFELFQQLSENAGDAVDRALQLVEGGLAPTEAADAMNLTADELSELIDIIKKNPEIAQRSLSAGQDKGYNEYGANPNKPGAYEGTSPFGKMIDGAFHSLGEILGLSARAEEDSYSVEKRQNKDTRKLTKEIKKNTNKRRAVDIDFEGTKLDALMDGESTAVVTVGFVPKGETESEDDSGSGLLGWLTALFAPGVPIYAILQGIANGSLSLVDIFGTILSVVALLTGQDPTSLSLGGVFGTVLSVLGALTGQQTSGAGVFASLASLFGSWFGIKAGLTGRESSGTGIVSFLTAFGSFFGIKAGLTGKQSSGTGIVSFATAFGSWFGIKAGLNGQQTTGTGIFSTLNALFGESFSVTSNLTGKKSGSNTLTDVYTNATTKALNFVTNLTGRLKNSKELKDAYLDGKGSFRFVSNLRGRLENSKELKDYYLNKNGNFGFRSNLNGRVNGSDTISSLYGTQLGVKSTLSKNNGSVADLYGAGPDGKIPIEAKVHLKGDSSQIRVRVQGGSTLATIMTEQVAALGGFIRAGGKLFHFAKGGALRGSIASMFGGINRYAGGTSRAHGTMFLAGEAGPEVVGHVGGRTEVLNKSQMAQAIYSAVVAGMTGAVNALGKYIANHMTTCTNAIVTTISANSIASGVNYYTPAMANGSIMPYEVSAQIARSTQALQNTLDANNDQLIQAIASAVSNATLTLVNAIQRANRGTPNQITTQRIIDEINRQSQMYNRSPLKGV